MKNACTVEFRCRAVGRWNRCDLYKEAPRSDDCIYLEFGKYCGNETAKEDALKDVE